MTILDMLQIDAVAGGTDTAEPIQTTNSDGGVSFSCPDGYRLAAGAARVDNGDGTFSDVAKISCVKPAS